MNDATLSLLVREFVVREEAIKANPWGGDSIEWLNPQSALNAHPSDFVEKRKAELRQLPNGKFAFVPVAVDDLEAVNRAKRDLPTFGTTVRILTVEKIVFGDEENLAIAKTANKHDLAKAMFDGFDQNKIYRFSFSENTRTSSLPYGGKSTLVTTTVFYAEEI